MADRDADILTDPRHIVSQSPMRLRQILAISMCVLLNALDGFDILSISFAAPGISAEWGVERGALGVVLSMELLGMAIGSTLLGQVADRVGRCFTVMGSLLFMAIGMLATTQVATISELAATRLFTGFGLGGMLVAINAMVTEYSNAKWRAACVVLVGVGYPIGAILGGSVVSVLLATGGWRDVFVFGAGITALCLPLVPLLMPEPVGALLKDRGPNTLDRINRSLRMLGHAGVAALPPEEAKTSAKTRLGIFSRSVAPVTLLLTIAYFMQLVTFYFILKWVPKIVADMGHTPSAAATVLVWANVGGMVGGLLFSALSLRFALQPLLILFMLASTVLVTVFGQGQSDLAGLALAAGTCGFFTNAAVVGLFALITTSFPTEIRGGGTGFVIGAGRGGAATGPILGGFLFQAGFGLQVVAAVMACGSLMAACAVFTLVRRSRRHSVGADVG